MPTAQSLLHLLGCAFLYGPKMAETSGLCDPFSVQDEEYTDESSIWYSSKHETTFTKLLFYLAQIARRGVFFRKLGAISSYWHGEFRDRWNIEASENLDRAAREWARPDWAPYYDKWIPS